MLSRMSMLMYVKKQRERQRQSDRNRARDRRIDRRIDRMCDCVPIACQHVPACTRLHLIFEDLARQFPMVCSPPLRAQALTDTTETQRVRDWGECACRRSGVLRARSSRGAAPACLLRPPPARQLAQAPHLKLLSRLQDAMRSFHEIGLPCLLVYRGGHEVATRPALSTARLP
jgi:hypothetical protein